jgi:hypothetical protein
MEMKTSINSLIIVSVCYFMLMLFPSANLLAQVTPCCDDIICENEARGYVNRFIDLTSDPLFADPPLKKPKEFKAQLNRLEKQDPLLYERFVNEIEAFTHWLEVDEGERAYCFYSHMDEAHEQNKNWVMETTSALRKIKPYSPEFCKGFGFQLEAATGVKDLATDSESFIGTLTGFVSYTFAPRDKNADIDTLYAPEQCNGRFRIMLGLSESYTDHIGLTQGIVRGEVKLFDIKTEFFSIGNVKGIAQANLGLNRKYHSVGLGVGADFEIVGFNILYGIGIENVHSILQTSLVYLF